MQKRAYIVFLVFLAILLYQFVGFATSLSRFRPTEAGRADAIVVLTGGTGRAEAGLKLLRTGVADLLILSGVDKDADVDSIFLEPLSAEEKARIVLEKHSTSTLENAREIKKLTEKLHLSSIVLITSVYHMRRAQFVFEKTLSPAVRIRLYPVESPNFDSHRWWKGEGLFIVMGEFLKYWWYYLRLSIAGG